MSNGGITGSSHCHSLLSFPTAAVLGIVMGAGSYLSFVRALRYRRRQKILDLYYDHQPLLLRDNTGTDTTTNTNTNTNTTTTTTTIDDDLDPEVARQIQFQVSSLEFPLVSRISLEFALFRTYAIPSISKLLQQTKQFETQCGKRYDDTSLLLEEMNNNPFDSERSRTALQRINAIHDMYRHQISNKDMLYVLSVFILEPKAWIDRWEWRSLTPEEYQAMFVTWKSVGTRMGIRDIPDTLPEFEAWSNAYEERNMTYAESNAVIGNATMDLFLGMVPTCLHSFGHQVAYCLMDSRLRAAMGYPKDTNAQLQRIVESVLAFRKYWIRYLSLPRLFSNQRVPYYFVSSSTTGLCPRYHVYEKTYPKGYETAKLGTAPAGKLMTSGVCPKYDSNTGGVLPNT